MRPLPVLLTILSAFTSVAAGASVDPGGGAAGASVLGDMCVTPAHWAPPFTKVYHLHNGATLVFVGVEHTRDLTDATHRQIKAAFHAYKPGFVLVEGASSAKSGFAWYRKFLADRATQQTDSGSAPETLYAVRLATDAGASFSGWDFSPDQDYRVLVDDRFDLRDALGAHLLRARVNPLEGDGGQRAVAEQLRYAVSVQPIDGFDFAAWYRKAYGDHFDPAAGTPCGTGIGSRVIKDLSYRRNLNLIAQIDSHAQPGTTVLVEAGANHWLAVRDWLAARSTTPRQGEQEAASLGS